MPPHCPHWYPRKRYLRLLKPLPAPGLYLEMPSTSDLVCGSFWQPRHPKDRDRLLWFPLGYLQPSICAGSVKAEGKMRYGEEGSLPEH